MSKNKSLNKGSDVLKEFQDFYQVIEKRWYNNIPNYTNLKKIHSTLAKLPDNWEYNLFDIKFTNINLGKKARPEYVIKSDNFEIRECYLLLGISIAGNSIPENQILDPLSRLTVDIHIQLKGYSLEDEHKSLLECTWHLDKHSQNQDEEHSEDANFAHPEYHLHFGGHKISKKQDFDFGNLLLIESPRVMHPPMDIILAIDFVVQNFYTKDEHKILTDQPIYQKIVRQAKERLWKPYFMGLAASFDKQLINQNYDINEEFVNSLT